MISFFTAFGPVAVLFSSEFWVRLPVGIVLVTVVLLTFWYVWTSLEARADYGLLEADVLEEALVSFTGGLGDAGDGDGQDTNGKFSQPKTMKETFNRLLLPRRLGPSTPPTPF